MSREVRRVPVGWEHPKHMTQYHGLTHVGLMGDYPQSVEWWLDELREVVLRKGHHWTFNVEYHLTGYQCRDESAPSVHPFYGWTDDGQTETETTVRDEDHLFELLLAKVIVERPNPADYMPVFEGDDLGWCLYETVSEGTPITPVFPTAEGLIDHLATKGDDWKREPYRREAAERLVSTGSSFGSFVIAGNVLYDGARDLDVIPTGGAS